MMNLNQTAQFTKLLGVPFVYICMCLSLGIASVLEAFWILYIVFTSVTNLIMVQLSSLSVDPNKLSPCFAVCFYNCSNDYKLFCFSFLHRNWMAWSYVLLLLQILLAIMICKAFCILSVKLQDTRGKLSYLLFMNLIWSLTCLWRQFLL